jgi:hypothetical protein
MCRLNARHVVVSYCEKIAASREVAEVSRISQGEKIRVLVEVAEVSSSA